MVRVMYKRVCVVSLLAMLTITSLFAGPFGLEMGMPPEEVTKLSSTAPEKVNDNLYKITPPKTHKLFETYVEGVSDAVGLFAIRAISKDIPTSCFGTELKGEFMDLVSSIERAYGEYQLYDFLRPGSIWDESRDFMMGMIEKERGLAAFWEKDAKSSLPDDLESVGVVARPASTSQGYLILEYTFRNFDEAQKKFREQQDSVF